jgi:hypothetical protein
MRNHEKNTSESLERLLGPTGPQISCDQCFELLDQYVELELSGVDADTRLPGLRNHLDSCPACQEDHESLRALATQDAASE